MSADWAALLVLVLDAAALLWAVRTETRLGPPRGRVPRDPSWRARGQR